METRLGVKVPPRLSVAGQGLCQGCLVSKKSVSQSQARRYARERALQALYQWELSGSDTSLVREEFIDRQEMTLVDVEHFKNLFNGISQNPDEVDELLEPALDRPVAELDLIERNVLRISVFELKHCLEIPAKAVINEAIEITKRFGADQGHKYVNGVIDKLALALRPVEMRAK